jgi:hypothetical protein
MFLPRKPQKGPIRRQIKKSHDFKCFLNVGSLGNGHPFYRYVDHKFVSTVKLFKVFLYVKTGSGSEQTEWAGVRFGSEISYGMSGSGKMPTSTTVNTAKES